MSQVLPSAQPTLAPAVVAPDELLDPLVKTRDALLVALLPRSDGYHGVDGRSQLFCSPADLDYGALDPGPLCHVAAFAWASRSARRILNISERSFRSPETVGAFFLELLRGTTLTPFNARRPMPPS